jgi:hypothetical protein
VRQPEAPPDQTAIAEQPPHFLGQRVGRNVEILGMAADDDVAHAAADQERLEARFLEAIQHAQRVGGNVRPRDRVFGARNDARRALKPPEGPDSGSNQP